MTADFSIRDLKSMLVAEVDRLVETLLPGAIRNATYFSAKNPTRPDRSGGSFVVWRKGAGAGAWTDYATGDKGDAIDLVAYLAIGAQTPPTREDRIAALAWIKDFLGIATMTPQQRAARARADNSRLEAARRAELAERDRKQARARSLWEDGRPVEGSLVETYLLSRGIDLARVENREASLRFAPRLEHPRAPHVGPAMLGCFTASQGGFAATHVTFLAEDGSGKTDVSPSKVIFGSYGGSVIRLTRGEGNLTPLDASRAGVFGPCGLFEGIESALSAALGAPHLRVWAVGSLNNFSRVMKPDCVDGWIVGAENDSHPQAVEQLERAIATLERTAPVSLARSFVGSDLNDLLRSGAHG